MPTYEITGPDGKVYEVTGEGTAEEALRHVQSMAGADIPPAPPARVPVPSPAPARGVEGQDVAPQNRMATGGATQAGSQGVLQGITAGWGDELMAGLLTPIEMGIDVAKGRGLNPKEAFARALAREREGLKAAQENHPVAETVGNIAGNVTAVGSIAKALPSAMAAGKGTLARVGAATGESAALGGIEGAGTAEGGLSERLEGAKTGAVIGGVTGGLVEGSVGSRAIGKATRKAANSATDLSKSVREGFDETKTAVLRGPKVNAVLGDVVKNSKVVDDAGRVLLDTKAVNRTAHPRTTEALKYLNANRITKAGTKQTNLEQMYEMVQHTKELAQTANGQDREMLDAIAGRLMNNIKALDDAGFQTANGSAAVRKLEQVVEQAKMRRKTKLMESIQRRVQSVGSGRGKHLRAELGKLLDGPNAKNFTPSEIAAIERVKKGKVADGLLEAIAYASPRNMKGFTLNALTALSGNFMVAGGMAAIGETGSALAKASVNRKMDELLRAFSTGVERRKFLESVRPHISSRAAAMLAARMQVEEDRENAK